MKPIILTTILYPFQDEDLGTEEASKSPKLIQ